MEPKVVGIEHRLSGTVVINVELPGVADPVVVHFFPESYARPWWWLI